jgi:hypothetical protein
MNNNLFFESNTCVVWVISALSSGVFPARNRCHSSDSCNLLRQGLFYLWLYFIGTGSPALLHVFQELN